MNLNVALNPGQPADTLNAVLTVTNSSAFDRSGVTLSMRYPLSLDALAESLITGGVTVTTLSAPTTIAMLQRF